MKIFAIIKNSKSQWEEDFVVSNIKTAEKEIKETINWFNKSSLGRGELKRELVLVIHPKQEEIEIDDDMDDNIDNHLIFCQIDDELIHIIKQYAKGRTVIDCGAGVGLLGSLMGDVVGLDLFPKESTLSQVIPTNCIEFSGYWGKFPVFIRPCHDGFPGKTLVKQYDSIGDAIYISKEENIEYDLHDFIEKYSRNKITKIEDWKGDDGEEAFYIKVNKKVYEQGVLYDEKPKDSDITRNKKVIYCADPMLSMLTYSIEEEFRLTASQLQRKGIVFHKVKFMEHLPMDEKYDILFFDWGGMSMGNDILGHYCRYIIEDSKKYPNRCFVMVSSFTQSAMEDAQYEFSGEKFHNIFLNVDEFCKYYNQIITK